MIDPLKAEDEVLTTVRLIPSSVIEPLGMMYLNNDPLSGVISNTTAFWSRLTLRISPVPSTCPWTICPPKRPPAAIARSRFIRLPLRSSLRLLLR
ncbi:hypothetical protein D3C80_1928350 [compost metagenome]